MSFKNLLKKLIPFKARRFLRKVQGQLRYSFRHKAYQLWILKYDRLSRKDQERIRQKIAELPNPPLISVVMPVYRPELKYFKAAVESVLKQCYPHFELILVEDGTQDAALQAIMQGFAGKDSRVKPVFLAQNQGISAATNAGIRQAKGEFIAFMDHDDLLSCDALYQVAKMLEANPKTDMLYSDFDHINALNIRHVPYFKSDWDPYLLLSQNYPAHFFVARKSLIEKVGGLRSEFDGSQDWDLILRLSEVTSEIKHIPHILYHWRRFSSHQSFSQSQISRTMEAGRRAVREHLSRRKLKAEVSFLKEAPYHRVQFALPAEVPKVSIIIPTKDGLALLKPCIDSLFKTVKNLPFEIIVINNNSEEDDTFAYFKVLQAQGIRVLDYLHPFNYPALNNFAAKEARGDVLLLLNNDIEAISEGWLEEMLSLVLQKDVGIVGAKLYYPNLTIQHAGVVLGMHKTAAHVETGLPLTASGYFSKLHLVHGFSAVTAACLMIRRDLFNQIGGMDEVLFPVTFNDIDLCVKVRALGYQVLWTPHAALYHKESATRGEDITPEKLARTLKEAAAFRHKWGDTLLQHDPFYNPNLSLNSGDYMLAFPPRVSRIK